MNINCYQDWSKKHPRAVVDYVLHNKEAIKVIAVDTETSFVQKAQDYGAVTRFIGREKNKNNIPFGVSLYYEHDEVPYGFWFDYDLIELKPLLECEDILKVFHNVKFDMHMLANIGIHPRGGLADTSVMIQDIDEEFMCEMPSGKMRRSKRLKDLGYHFVTTKAHKGEDELKKLKRVVAKEQDTTPNRVSYLDLYKQDHDAMVHYAIFDTELTYKLYYKLLPQIIEQELEKVVELDIEATISVYDMERTGVKLDAAKLATDMANVNAMRDGCISEMHKLAGMFFPVDNSRAIVSVFLLLGSGKWLWFTDAGREQTTGDVLKKLEAEGKTPEVKQFAKLVQDYRSLNKIYTTYLLNLEFYNQNGRIHCSYNIAPDERGQGGTKTGRTSSSHPNMQNIPKEAIMLPNGEKLKMREYFIPTSEEYMFFAMDADQEEYRLLAHYGRDERFMKFVKEGKDIHASTAAMMFSTSYENATLDKKLRAKGKTMNFALSYGLGVASMTNVLFKEFDEAIYKTASKYLYNKVKVYDLPPYKDKYSVTDFIEVGMDDALVFALRYFFHYKTCEMIQEAVDTREQYFKIFPGIRRFIKGAGDVGSQRGWVKTWYGRRRHFKNPQREGYKAPNSIIQGGCGDILKLKLWELRLYLTNKRSRMVLQTHDEILFEIHRDDAELIKKINRKLQDLDFRVPITWGTEGSVKSWSHCSKEYADELSNWRTGYGTIEVEE